MTMPEYAKPFLEFARLLYSVTAMYEVLLRVAMVLVGMYLLVSDTVVVVAVVMLGVVWGWSFLDSLTFEPPPPVSCCGGTGEGVLVSRVLSGVLRASSISSCALVMERWVPYNCVRV